MAQQFRHVDDVTLILLRHYGRQNLGNKQDPFDELLYIILSAKTPPTKYQQAYEVVKTSFSNPEDLTTVEPEYLASLIRFAGLENKKARQIIEAAKVIKRKYGKVTLQPLENENDIEAEAFLTALPGIGLKSARCILMYSLQRQVFPADNHCLRIANRVGWVKQATFTKTVANELQSGIPPHLRYDLHVGLVLLGREYCAPKYPICSECPILHLCPTGSAIHS